MNKTPCLIALVLAWVALPLRSQTQPPPKEPFVSPISGNAHWVIQVKKLEEKPVPVAAPKSVANPQSPMLPPTPPPDFPRRSLAQIDTTRGDGLLRRINYWTDGTQTEKWWAGEYCLLKAPHSVNISIFPWTSMILDEASNIEFSATDFPELRWVGAQTFLEWTTIGETPVAVYGQKQSDADRADLAHNRFMLKFLDGRADEKSRRTSRDGYARLAWINGMTKRPIAIETAHAKWTYSFTEQPVPPMEPPPDFREAMGRYLEAAKVQKWNVRP